MPVFRPTFSPDGRTIAVGVERALSDEYAAPRRTNLALERANRRGGLQDDRVADLTEADREPAWSPDARRLVFVGLVAEVPDLYTVRPDGSDLKRVTADREIEGRPVWSTRGLIAFERDGGIWSVRRDGTGLRRLAPRGRTPDWSPDGSRLVFERDQRLYTVSRTGQRLRRLVGTGAYPAWSPSGRRIAFRRKYDIYAARPDGTRSRRVYDWVRPAGSAPRRRYAPRDISWGPKAALTSAAVPRAFLAGTPSRRPSGGRCSSIVKRLLRSTSVPIAELPTLRVRSPSQGPATARSSAAGISACQWAFVARYSSPPPRVAALRRPVDFAQYTSAELVARGGRWRVLASVGSTGDA